MNKLDLDYQNLLQDILDNGVTKQDRTGTGTISVFGRQIRHKMSEGFPLLTTKKIHFKSVVGELLWFLKGSTDIRKLWEDDIKIWDGDWYKQYKNTCSEPYSLEEIKQKVKNGGHYFHDSMFDMGPIYGKQWRSWTVPRMEPKGFDFDTAWEKSQKIWKSSNGMECGPSFETFCMSLLKSEKMGVAYGYHSQVDQIQNLINDLKTKPDSRRLMVNAWNVGELDQMVLPPCHYGFQVYTRELSQEERFKIAYKNLELRKKLEAESAMLHYPSGHNKVMDDANIPTRAISLMWNQRSVDTFLGLPFNIASYGLLLEIIAKEVNMVPDELIGNLGDVHLYLSDHIEAAKEQISREPYPLPTLKIENEVKWVEGDCLPTYSINDFTIENYQSHSKIKATLSN